MADPALARERQLTVQLGHTITFGECRRWVGSGSTVKSYLESIPTSEFGATTDVH